MKFYRKQDIEPKMNFLSPVPQNVSAVAGPPSGFSPGEIAWRQILQIHHRRVAVKREGAGALVRIAIGFCSSRLAGCVGRRCGKARLTFGAANFAQDNPAGTSARWRRRASLRPASPAKKHRWPNAEPPKSPLLPPHRLHQ